MTDALSPLDGRYRHKLGTVRKIMSEDGLILARAKVEIAWLEHLNHVLHHHDSIPQIPLPEDFCSRVRQLEKTTNHDVKAVEYAIAGLIRERSLPQTLIPWIHFACTSEDINNLSYALMLSELRRHEVLPMWTRLEERLSQMAKEFAEFAMLSYTHGQPASPTTMGKEMAVFAYRFRRQKNALESQEMLGKFNGATGNFNAHLAALPDLDWLEISRSFVEDKLGLTWNPLTTQIESHDWIAEFTQRLALMSTVATDLSRDMWAYISLGYFRLKVKSTETGSSTMPHKVNPIDFENAEGNFGVCVALAHHLAEKLPISRLQRDLSDSTVLRQLAHVAGQFVLACTSLEIGLSKVDTDPEKMLQDLQQNPEVLTEMLQTVLRRYGSNDAYEQMKDLSRGKKLSLDAIRQWIRQSSVLPPDEKERLCQFTPENYIGLAPQLARQDFP